MTLYFTTAAYCSAYMKPAERVMAVVENVVRTKGVREYHGLSVIQRRGLRPLDYDWDGPPMTPEELTAHLRPYQQDDIRVKLAWRVRDRYEVDEYAGDPMRTSWFAELEAVGKDFFYPHDGNGYDFTCIESKTQSAFDPLHKGTSKAAPRNIASFLADIDGIVSPDIETMRGLSIRGSEHPPDTILCFHRDPNSYYKDFLAMGKPMNEDYVITAEDVEIVAELCDDTDYIIVDGLPIVYAKYMTGGRLARFYSRLYRFVRSQQTGR